MSKKQPYYDIVTRLREGRNNGTWLRWSPNEITLEAADEIERLQRIIDSRPAINADLPHSYIEWSHSIFTGEAITTQKGLDR